MRQFFGAAPNLCITEEIVYSRLYVVALCRIGCVMRNLLLLFAEK